MKRAKLLMFLALLLFAGGGALRAQDSHVKVFQLKKNSAENDTLLSGWKLMPGDNRKYALPGYVDTTWPDLDPGGDLDTFKYPARICWIRLHLNIDSALGISDFALLVYQNAASEIYVDGKLFKSYGVVSADPVAYNPLSYPEHIALSPGMHVIAVRLIVPRAFSGIHVNGFPVSIFTLNINQYHSAAVSYQQSSDELERVDAENLFLMGIFFILTVTHLFFYLYHRRQKAHLYYSFTTFILLCDTLLNIVMQRQHSLLVGFWLDELGNLSFVGFIFLPLTIYAIYDYKKRRAIKIILAISALCLLSNIFTNAYDGIIFFYLIPICNAIECVRIGLLARKNKQRGAIFIITGSSLFLILLGLQNSVPGVAGEVLFVLTLLSLPVGMTIFLATQTALTYRALETKLVEVQELSEKNLQYQLEKQQLLAEQNETLEQQVRSRTAELSSALDNLKATQTQLIQSEKMASLGELTAGIAHEIQNPLNFVNNFSEVNQEMLQELKAESEKPKAERDDQLETELIDDLINNEKKINHHGKRADGIVKGMLEHSRTSTGQKEPTDLNKLVDEYLKLAYHGLRAKDKSFNADLITHFDEDIHQVSVSPQDIGRVLLNLFNNAFYAVNEKKKTTAVEYKPEVTVTTFSPPLGGRGVVITVRDNGTGIPDNIKDKIMQPFFTTKPTGESTGLGLSLSYDIVVKGHGGTIEVNSIPGEHSEFIINLPRDGGK